MSKNQNSPLPHVLIVDDDEHIRRILKEILELAGCPTSQASDGQACLDMVAQNPEIDVIILDITMPNGMNGDKALKTLRETNPEIPVIMFSAHSDTATVVEMVRQGAYDFLPKPPDIGLIMPTILKAMQRKKELNDQEPRTTATYRNRGGLSPNQAISNTTSSVHLFGECAPMLEFKDKLAKVAKVDVALLLLGENGTGKTISAKWIHENSERRKGPFITVNTNAISETMFEGELFGFKKGAHSTATKNTKGALSLAEGGTLFIDEIGNLPISFQQKLLNVINDLEFKILGDEKYTKLNCRIITATNKDLLAEVAAGKIMIDFYYRIARVMITTPPLRDRGNEILELFEYYNNLLATQFKNPPVEVHPSAIAALKNHRWPGNVREVENLLVNLHIFHNEQAITPQILSNYHI